MKQCFLFKIRYIRLSAIALFACICLIFTSTTLIAKSPDWVVRSNMSADLLSKAIAAQDCQKKLAVSTSLQEINPAFKTCRQKSVLNAVQTLEQKLDSIKNPQLRLDLEILVQAGRRQLRAYELDEKYRIPYINLSQAILDSLKNTAKETKSSSKQQAILTKLNQYAGIESSQIALVTSVERAIETQLHSPKFVLPSPEELKQNLNNNASNISKILKFLRQQQVPNYQSVYAELKTQLFDYETFVRSQILTKAKANSPLPAELYAFELKQQGIGIPATKLIQQARTVFTQVQRQMDEMAQEIAQQRGIKVSGYREMIQTLKQ